MSKPRTGHNENRRRRSKLLPAGVSVGEAQAEQDALLLRAFHDKGDLAVLLDTRNPRSIVAGRTGAGKTALLLKIEADEERAIRINPEQLSIRLFIASSIIPTLHRLGIHLDPFYKEMWRHVFVVELVRKRFNITDDVRQRSFFSTVRSWLRKPGDLQLIRFVEEHGDRFWQNTATHIRNITTELEQRVERAIGGKLSEKLSAEAQASRNSKRSVSEEQRDLVHQAVAAGLHNRLPRMFDLIKDRVLEDDQKPYYIIIDDLDRDWVEREYVYDLINALIDVVGDFARVPNVKVIVALRENILHKTFVHARKGFGNQTEKQRTLVHSIRWKKHELIRLLDARISEATRGEYGQVGSVRTILPQSTRGKGSGDPLDFMIRRTFLRPRDIITFFNYCLEEMEGGERLTMKAIRKAERKYSSDRYGSLIQEWNENFPGIQDLMDVFAGMEDGLEFGDLPDHRFEEILRIGCNADEDSMPYRLYAAWDTNQLPMELFKAEVMKYLYTIGFFGMKLNAEERITFSYEDPGLLEAEHLRPDSKVYFHPAMYRRMGVENPHWE